MTLYYRGAGAGTYWNTTDARIGGFVPQSPGLTASASRIIQHVAHGMTQSPYISLSRSYSVALSYALDFGTISPTVSMPGYVYELEIDANSGVRLVDPVKEIVADAGDPFAPLSYHHDGYPTVLLGVVSPSLMAYYLHLHVAQVGGTASSGRPANISHHLRAMTLALRDAEILVFGNVPSACVQMRHSVS